ncbi:hypothetical protein [Pedobacter sp. GR22-6]|uniref:hypothetical protein n=1 Tax=Pedobacter sp. GR22-6 TaxID=3127957 RepID=UPI00307F1BCB
MKATLLFLMFTLFLANSQAQNHVAGFTVSIADASSSRGFDLHPDLDHLTVEYSDGKPMVIYVYKQKNKSKPEHQETFYMNFEGDRYAVNKLYPGLRLPQEPKLSVWHFPNLKQTDSSVYAEVKTTIRRDSLIHNFSYFINVRNKDGYSRPGINNGMISVAKSGDTILSSDTVYFLHPKLKKDPLVLQQKLNDEYKRWKPLKVADSALIFTGVVEKNGSFTELKLHMGKPSPFSDRVIEFINQRSLIWWPRSVNGIYTVRHRTKIFVKLNPDDRISFSTL